MRRNDPAAPSHVSPGSRIHTIDIVQPPQSGISLIAESEVQRKTVAAALAAKSTAEMAQKACSDARPETLSRDISLLRSTGPWQYLAQRGPYSSWRRHQMPASFRPLGAR